ncbi:YlzJ-like family protein [Bacillus chungangensis]|uniref:Uncharacterized protein n=1 Tax=Bacillus chungangensis TaxID=587633 RepID=A0ABT9WRF8_9BACI|nr:YlzJ-like family protein [Bacillus chungangensis]MDQ0175756.1 hypothetical protein [Bacillus chungangensis]
MILHTTIPQELIFPQESNMFTQQTTVEVNGISLIVEQEENRYRIIRLLSSNPNDYLRSELLPGQYLSI